MTLAALFALAMLQVLPPGGDVLPRTPKLHAPAVEVLTALKAAQPALATHLADVPPEVLAAARAATGGRLLDSDQPLETGQTQPGRLIWGAKAGDYYVLHWERMFQVGIGRRVTILQMGPNGRSLRTSTAIFACDPISDKFAGSFTCKTSTKLATYADLLAAFYEPVADRNGQPLPPAAQMTAYPQLDVGAPGEAAKLERAQPSALAVRVADISPDVLAAAKFETGTLIDPDQPLEPEGSPYTRPSRLIWGARAGDEYVLHWEKVFQTGPARQVTVLHVGPGGRPYVEWNSRFQCEPFGDHNFETPSNRCSTPTKLTSVAELVAAMKAPLINTQGQPVMRPGPIGLGEQPAAAPSMPADLRTAILSARDPKLTRRVADLPANLTEVTRFLIGMRTEGDLGDAMSDTDGPFTPYDVVIVDKNGRAPPAARLVWTAQVGPYYVLHWQRGGMAHADFVQVFEPTPDHRLQMLWQGHRRALLGDPRAVMTDFPAFQTALSDDEIITDAGGSQCRGPLNDAGLPVNELEGFQKASAHLTRVADLPPELAARLPNAGRVADASQSLLTPATAAPGNSRLIWADKVGDVWFVQMETEQSPPTPVVLISAGLAPVIPPKPPLRTSQLLAFRDGPQGWRQVFRDNGDHLSLDGFRDLLRRTSLPDVREAAAASRCQPFPTVYPASRTGYRP